MVVKQLSKAVTLMGDIAQAQSVGCTDTQVAGGNVYSLFQVDGESTLYSCNGMQDESTFEDYCRYVVQSDGTLQEESRMSRKRELNEDYSVFLLPVVSTKYFLPSTPHISSLFLNVPNLRCTFL